MKCLKMTGKNNYPDSLFHSKRRSVFESKQCLRSMQGSVSILIWLLYNNKVTHTLITLFIIQTYILSTRTSTTERKNFRNQNYPSRDVEQQFLWIYCWVDPGNSILAQFLITFYVITVIIIKSMIISIVETAVIPSV